MPQNGIYHEGISALADAFGHNHRMEVCLFIHVFVPLFCFVVVFFLLSVIVCV